MANEYAVNSEDLTSVANAIREKGGTEDALSFPAGFVTAIENIRAGGGASLNVIAASSFSALPETADEGTMAVITDTAIGAVYVQKAQPETAAAGDIFISTAANLHTVDIAGDEGSLQIPLGFVHVWNGTAWEQAEAYFHTDGKWIPQSNIVYLYNAGSVNEQITGGWIAAEGGGTATMNAANMRLVISSSTGIRKHVATTNMIDLTGYATLHVVANFASLSVDSSTAPSLRLGVSTNQNANLASITTKAEKAYTAKGEKTLSYDVSSLDGEYYVIVGVGWPTATVNITQVWLEKAV